MQFYIREMNEIFATDILGWKYEEPYDFYNNDLCDESLKEILENPYYSIVNDKEELVGYFCTGTSAQVPIGREAKRQRQSARSERKSTPRFGDESNNAKIKFFILLNF